MKNHILTFGDEKMFDGLPDWVKHIENFFDTYWACEGVNIGDKYQKLVK